MPTSNVQNVKYFYDPDDLEKVQGQTYDMQSKVLSLCILGINIKSLPHMVTDLCTFVHPIGYTKQPRYNATHYNAISDTTLFFLGSQIIFKKYLWGSADMRNSSIFAHVIVF